MTTKPHFRKPDQQRTEMLEWLVATAHSQPQFDLGIGDAYKVSGSYFRGMGFGDLASMR